MTFFAIALPESNCDLWAVPVMYEDCCAPDAHEEHEYQLATEHGFHAVDLAWVHHVQVQHDAHVHAFHWDSEDIPF